MRATVASMAMRISKGTKRPPPPGQPNRRSTASYAQSHQSGQMTVTFKLKVADMEPNERLYMVGGTVFQDIHLASCPGLFAVEYHSV